MTDGAATNIGFGDLAHLDSRQHTRGNSRPFEGILQCKGVHAGGKHADIVRLAAVHALCRTRHASEDIAAAHGDRKLNSVVVNTLDFAGKLFYDLGIDAVAGIPHQGLAGQFQQNTMIFVILRHALSLPFYSVRHLTRIRKGARRSEALFAYFH